MLAAGLIVAFIGLLPRVKSAGPDLQGAARVTQIAASVRLVPPWHMHSGTKLFINCIKFCARAQDDIDIIKRPLL